MGIRFLCPSCGKRINVKEQQAGLRGFCPKCGAGIDIPLESQLPSRSEQTASTLAVARTARANAAAAEAAANWVDPLHENPAAVWYALPPGAPKPYGPIDGLGLSQWFYEGRLSPDSMVWRQDWPEWLLVSQVWPNWAPNKTGTGPGTGPGGEPMIDPPADGSAYPLKAVKAESVARPPVISTKAAGTGTAERGLSKPVAPTLGGGAKTAATIPKAALPGTVPVPIGTTVPGAGVYYRRRTNRAYMMTVVVLVLIVVALGGVMIWVLTRKPTPKKKPDATTATASATAVAMPNPTTATSAAKSAAK